jgi:hypothetical protein
MFARPVTTLIIEFTCESGVLGFEGAGALAFNKPSSQTG